MDDKDIGIIEHIGVPAGIVISLFGEVIIQATGKSDLKNEVLIRVVKQDAPSIKKFGAGIVSKLIFSSVLKVIPVLKLIVPLALPV